MDAKYIKINPNNDCYSAFLSFLKEDIRVSEKLNEFTTLYKLNKYHPELIKRTLVIVGPDVLNDDVLKNQVTLYEFFPCFKFRKESDMYEIWENYRKKHKLKQQSIKPFLLKFISSELDSCELQWFFKDNDLYFMLKTNKAFEVNSDYLIEIDEDVFLNNADFAQGTPLEWD